MRYIPITVGAIPKNASFLTPPLPLSKPPAKMDTFSHYLSTLILFLSLTSPSALNPPQSSLSSQEAIALVEIQQVINLFALAVDQHRWDLLSQVFPLDVTRPISSSWTVGGLPVVPRPVKSLHRIRGCRTR